MQTRGKKIMPRNQKATDASTAAILYLAGAVAFAWLWHSVEPDKTAVLLAVLSVVCGVVSICEYRKAKRGACHGD